MLEFSGQHATCKVMTDQVEPEAIKQIYAFLDCPAFEGSKASLLSTTNKIFRRMTS